MVRPASFRRGDVWLADFDPTVGSEIRKTRRCLIVSPDYMNDNLRRVAVAPLTSGSHPAPFRIDCVFAGKPGRILADQIRTLDRLRFRKHLGELDRTALDATLVVLRDMFAD